MPRRPCSGRSRSSVATAGARPWSTAARPVKRRHPRGSTPGGMRALDGELGDVPADATTLVEVVAAGNALNDGLVPAGGRDGGGVSPAGSAPVRSAAATLTVRSSSATTRGTSSSRAAITCRRSKREHAVMSHPSVMEAAAVADPDERWSEVPTAFVSLNPRASATAEDLTRHARERTAHHKASRHIEFGDLATCVDREDPEVPAPREGVGGEGEPDQLTGHHSARSASLRPTRLGPDQPAARFRASSPASHPEVAARKLSGSSTCGMCPMPSRVT